MIFAPFGMTLRACRDAPLRAEAIGIDIRTHQWLAFTIAGTFAGLAGGILAFLKGTIDPTWLAIPQSIEGLVMVLLGGVQTLAGPLVGAARLPRPRDLVLDAHPLLAADPRPDHRRASCWPSRTASSAGCSAAAASPRPPDDGPRGRRASRKAFGGVQAVHDVSFAPRRPASCSP